MSYELVETVTVGAGGAASIEFTSIPQDGTDLVLLTSLRTTRTGNTGDNVNLFLNNSSSNFSTIFLYGNGASALSFTGTQTVYYTATDEVTANTFGNGATLISNYAGSSNKSISTDGLGENNATAAVANISATVWADTSAITSVKIAGANGNFVQYSSASLYKITAA